MEPGAQPAINFDPNGPGMGLDFNFGNFQVDLGDIDSNAINIDPNIANLNFGFNNTVDFDNFNLGCKLGTRLDIDINNGIMMSANFNFEDALEEAILSLEPHETFQDANMSSLGHLSPLKLQVVNEKSDDPLTVAEASNSGTSAHPSQEPVHSNEMRAQKRKKTDEVDKGCILPEGSR